MTSKYDVTHFAIMSWKKKRTSRIKEIFKKKENVIDKEFENYIKYQNKIIKINIDDKILHNDYKEKQAT